VTVTFLDTLQNELNNGNPTSVANIIKLMQLGTMLSPIKVTSGTITATAAPVITSAAFYAGATVTGVPAANEEPAEATLPAILVVRTLRVTASGTAASVGSYIVSDAGGTPTLPTGGASAGVGIATLSDDGTTITFPNTVTAFVLEYVARSATDLQTAFAPANGQ
jgi:hypothetical protein